MEPVDRETRLETIFAASLELDEEARRRYLDDVCASDPGLRQDVESLLDSYRTSPGFLELPAYKAAAELLLEPLESELEGRLIGHYQIVDRLGFGGMGEVYRAVDVRLGRHVAIKALPSHFARSASRLVRLENEARVLASLNHPNIAILHGLEEHDGIEFLVMECVEGESLDTRLKAGPVPLSEALMLFGQLAQALAAAHSKGIVHRDLKPGNLRITPDGTLKVLDFGLAEALPAAAAGDAESAPDSARLIAGTPAYLGPEQARGEQVDRRADIWAFGCVLFEALAGARPFEGATIRELLEAVKTADPAWERLPAETPAPVRDLIRSCLQKDAAVRLAEISEARIVLAKELRRLEEPAPVPPIPAAGDVTGGGWRRWRVLSVATLALAAAGAAALVGWRMWRAEVPAYPPLMPAPLTSFPGAELFPAFSPDGNRVVFSWDGESGAQQDLYVKEIGNERLVRLTNDPAPECYPAWSPDGRQIAFLHCAEGLKEGYMAGPAGLFVVPVSGGGKLQVAEIDCHLDMPVRPMTWAHDSKALIARERRENGSQALVRIDLGSGSRTVLTFPTPGTIGDQSPVLSDDGRNLAFTRSTAYHECEILAVNLGSDGRPAGKPRSLARLDHPFVNLMWPAGNSELVYSASATGAMGLWRLDVNAGSPRRVSMLGRLGLHVTISPRGDRLVYAESYSDMDIWKQDLPPEGKPVPPPVKLIQSNLSDVSPRISPDGRRVAFDSSRSGAGHVWVCDRFGRNPVQVTSWEEESGSARWSPQGDELALDSAVDGNADVFVVRDDGSWLRRLTEDPATDCVPSWSQDGKWIYFASNRSGRFEIWKVGTNGETAVQQTRHGGFAGVESTDGRYLYYARDDQRPTKLLRMPVAGGEEEVVLEDLRRWPYFALLHDGVCYVPDAAPAPRFEVLFADPIGKNVRSLVTIPRSLGFGFSVAPDRTWILFAHSEFRGSDLVLVDNFR